MQIFALLALGILFTTGTSFAQQPETDPRDMGGGECALSPYNCADAVNPLPATQTVWLEEMTWIDVRDALRAGRTNIIIPTGGVEPNGVWLALGKHNYILHANCEAIARKMGNALCAPIVKFVPEGEIEPKTGHMISPGTISVREDTYQALLTDIAESLQAHGFRNILFIGDSGGNQKGQGAVADKLTAKWAGRALALHIAEYYDDYDSASEYLQSLGVKEGPSDHMHDDPVVTLNMFIDDPDSVRHDERVKAGKASINGVDIADEARNTELGRKLVEYRATRAVEAINRAIAAKGRPAASTP